MDRKLTITIEVGNSPDDELISSVDELEVVATCPGRGLEPDAFPGLVCPVLVKSDCVATGLSLMNWGIRRRCKPVEILCGNLVGCLFGVRGDCLKDVVCAADLRFVDIHQVDSWSSDSNND